MPLRDGSSLGDPPMVPHAPSLLEARTGSLLRSGESAVSPPRADGHDSVDSRRSAPDHPPRKARHVIPDAAGLRPAALNGGESRLRTLDGDRHVNRNVEGRGDEAPFLRPPARARCRLLASRVRHQADVELDGEEAEAVIPAL